MYEFIGPLLNTAAKNSCSLFSSVQTTFYINDQDQVLIGPKGDYLVAPLMELVLVVPA